MLLELRRVSKRYGAMLVVPDLSLAVEEGDFVGVIGPNGAGKSTVFGLISGGLRCDSGKVFLGGADVTALDADERCRAGIGRTFQIPHPFEGMTAYENALVAATFGAALRGRQAHATTEGRDRGGGRALYGCKGSGRTGEASIFD